MSFIFLHRFIIHKTIQSDALTGIYNISGLNVQNQSNCIISIVFLLNYVIANEQSDESVLLKTKGMRETCT